MVYISYNCAEKKAYILEHDDELIIEKKMSFAEAVRLALKLGINIIEDDDLTNNDWEEVREMLIDYDIELYSQEEVKTAIYVLGIYNQGRCNGLFK